MFILGREASDGTAVRVVGEKRRLGEEISFILQISSFIF